MKSSLVRKIYPKSVIERLDKKNKLLGISYNYDLDSLLKSHLLISVFIFLIILIIKNDLMKMLKNNPDKIVLGCTHYPYLMK